MKKIILIPVSILLIITACNKKDGGSKGVSEAMDVEYSQIEDVIVSDNGLAYGFMFLNNDEKDDIYYVHVNGTDYGAFEYLDGPVFSADGSAYGYLYDKSQESYFNVNGTDYGPYQNGQWLQLSEDGSAFGFSYLNDEGWYIKVNESDYGPYYWAGSFRFFNGAQFSFIFETNGENNLMVNGTNLIHIEDIEDYSVSPDGTEFAYITYKNSAQYLTVAGTEYGPYEEVWSPAFSENGEKWGCVFRRGDEWFVLINSEEFGSYDGVGEIAVSADGSRWAAVYRIGWKYYVSADDSEIGEFSSPSDLAFSLDGTSYAFLYRDDGTDWLNLNGEAYGGYDGVGYSFTGNNEIAICSVSNQTVRFELREL